MPNRTVSNILTLFALALVSATIAFAQFPTSPGVPATSTTSNWEIARQVGASKRNLFVITLDEPHRRQTCRIQSFTLNKLVCSRRIGRPRTYVSQQILALILPGDNNVKLRLLIGFNAGLGAAIWGTVVLAATCPACAVATGIMALFLFGAAGGVLITDGQPDRLLYLAPGQQLTGKLRSFGLRNDD